MINGKVCACGKSTLSIAWHICEDCHKAELRIAVDTLRLMQTVKRHQYFNDVVIKGTVKIGGDDE